MSDPVPRYPPPAAQHARTYAQALEAIETRGRYGIRLGLGRVRALLRAMGDPELAVRGALVAGTNGKGTVIALAGSALRAAGYRVGETPKPHLVTYRERIVVDGRPIAAADFARLVDEALPAADRIARRLGPPTEFELAGARVNAADHRGVAGNVVEFDGNLGLVIGAGGGSLTLFDAVRKHGGKPANYCEIGGNPSVKKACELTKLVLSKPGVEKIAVMMNVVSNTRVDIVARGVIKACLELGMDPAEKIAIFRIPGAWEEEGFKILEKYGVEYADRSVSMHEAARRAVEKIGAAA